MISIIRMHQTNKRTHSKGAVDKGVRVIENCPVIEVVHQEGKVVGVKAGHDGRLIKCDKVVLRFVTLDTIPIES